MAEKITQVFFALFLLLFPLGEIGRLGFGNDISVKISDIVLGFAICSWLITKKKNVSQRKQTKPILLFVIVCFLSLFVNSKNFPPDQLFVAFLYLLRWSAYAGLYFMVIGFDLQFKKKIMHFLTFVGFLVVVAGYIQYFLYPDLRNLYYVGWDEHLYRMFSTFLDPNFAGAFFVLYLLLLIGLFWNVYNQKQYGKMQLYGGLAVLTFCAILLTFSRSAFIMLFVSITIFLMQIKKTRLLFGIFVLSIIFLGIVSRSLQSEGTNLLRTASNESRIEGALRATTIFLDNPLFGVGFNAYRYAQEKYGFTKKSQYQNHAGAGTDNSFLFVLATTGIVGFGTYMYLLRAILLQARSSNNVMSKILFCSILGLFVSSFFINSLFYPFVMAWVWILVGVTEQK